MVSFMHEHITPWSPRLSGSRADLVRETRKKVSASTTNQIMIIQPVEKPLYG